MNNLQQFSPMDHLRAFAIVFIAGALTTAVAGLAGYMAKKIGDSSWN
jgi:hypothetical protein